MNDISSDGNDSEQSFVSCSNDDHLPLNVHNIVEQQIEAPYHDSTITKRSRPTTDTTKPPQISHPTTDTTKPPQISHPTTVTTKPPQISHPTTVTTKPPQISHPTTVTTKPPQISRPTTVTTKPPQISRPTTVTTKPPEVYSSGTKSYFGGHEMCLWSTQTLKTSTPISHRQHSHPSSGVHMTDSLDTTMDLSKHRLHNRTNLLPTLPEEIGPVSRQTNNQSSSRSKGCQTIIPRTKPLEDKRDQINDLRMWIQELKATRTESCREKQLQLDLAEKKLELQQRERRSLEDVRVTRLRALLNTATISEPTTTEVMSLQLSTQQLDKVTMATRGGPAEECLSKRFNISISRGDLCTLIGLNWLNDNVVNFYFNLIGESQEKVHVMSSFFYPKLSQSGYSSVRRWTKKVDIFSMDIVLLPIHLGMHWCLAVIDFRKHCLSYYDSLLGNNSTCLPRLREYLEKEHNDKKSSLYDLSSWKDVVHRDIPLQENGSDCGVFMCMYARHIAANASFLFSQDNMQQIRKHMICEIVDQNLF